MLFKRTTTSIAAATALLAAAACSHGAMLPAQPPGVQTSALTRTLPDKETSILKMLKKQVVIGSTIDPKLQQLNPYGLTVAPATTGDFDRATWSSATSTRRATFRGPAIPSLRSIRSLARSHSWSPTARCCSDARLSRLGPADDIWATAFSADDNPVLSPPPEKSRQHQGQGLRSSLGAGLRAAEVGEAARSTKPTPAKER